MNYNSSLPSPEEVSRILTFINPADRESWFKTFAILGRCYRNDSQIFDIAQKWSAGYAKRSKEDARHERNEFFPDVPTAIEEGVNVVNQQNRGFVIHKSVPAEIVQRLEEIFKQIAEDENFQAQAKDLEMEVKWMGTEEYAEYLAEEDELYKGIIQSNGLGDKY